MATGLLYLAPFRLNDSTGAPAPGIPVKVSGTVYVDPVGNVPFPNNIVTTDAGGNISFYAAAGSYTLQYTPTNATGQVVTLNLPLTTSSATINALIGCTEGPELRSFLGFGAQPCRSNIELPMYSGAMVDTASLGGTTSGVAIAVPVPVDVGMTVTNVSFLVGATAASTPTHGFAALYSGTTVTAPPLIIQATDITTTAIAASARFDFALSSPTVITSAMAPYGFVYAALMSTVTTTVCSAITVPCGAAAGQYRWFTNTPLYFSQTAGSGLTTTAAATLAHASTLTVAPIVFLW